MVGALVIVAASCVAAGFAIGRMTAAHKSGDTAPRLARAGGETPTAAAPVSGVPSKNQPGPDAPVAPANATPPVVILNPGSADGSRQEDRDKSQDTRFRDASRLRSDVRNLEPRDMRPPAPDRIGGGNGGARETDVSRERDYRALRDYMLRR